VVAATLGSGVINILQETQHYKKLSSVSDRDVLVEEEPE